MQIKESGSEYIITPVEWNKTIPNGGSVEFGATCSGNISQNIRCYMEGSGSSPAPTQTPAQPTKTPSPADCNLEIDQHTAAYSQTDTREQFP